MFSWVMLGHRFGCYLAWSIEDVDVRAGVLAPFTTQMDLQRKAAQQGNTNLLSQHLSFDPVHFLSHLLDFLHDCSQWQLPTFQKQQL